MLIYRIQKILTRFSLRTNTNLFIASVLVNALLLIVILLALIYLFNQRGSLDKLGSEIASEIISLEHIRSSASHRIITRNPEKNSDTNPLVTSNPDVLTKIEQSRDKFKKIYEESVISDLVFSENIRALFIDYESLLKEYQLFEEYLMQLGNNETGLYMTLMSALDDFKSKSVPVEHIVQTSAKTEELSFTISMLSPAVSQNLIYHTESVLNQMVQQLSLLNKDSSNYMIVRVADSFENVNKAFQQYARKILEIGYWPNKGLLNKLYVRTNKIEQRLNDSMQIIQEQKAYRNNTAIVFLISLIVVLPFLNLMLIYFFMKREKGYREIFEKYILQLEKGMHLDLRKDEVLPDIYPLVEKFKDFAIKFENAENVLTKLAKGVIYSDFAKQPHFEVFKQGFNQLKGLLEDLNKQIAREKDAQKEMIWIKNGIDRLTEVMRQEYDNPLLHANEIINMLVDYLQVPIGAIYLAGEENNAKFVEMASAFAYGREKQLYKKVAFGEGIVGIAASEQKTMVINNIPENYFTIISGFGETRPRSILVSPIKLNRNIYGVIELASLSKFKDDEVKFIEEVCKTIAFSFAISKTYIDTVALFENSNLQIAELEAENESLRNDYEDITISYKELNSKAENNEFLVARLNELCIRATLDIDGNITEVNSRFELLYKADRSKFILTNYRDYMAGAKFSQDIDFEYFWKDIRAGMQNEIETGVQIAGDEYWLRQYFYPVKDSKGRVKKIQMIAFDITELFSLRKEAGNLKKK
jgi:PAS domain-containing protein